MRKVSEAEYYLVIIVPYTCLTTKVPNLKFQVFVGNLFYIKTYCWNSGYNFTNLKSITMKQLRNNY